MVQVIIVDDEQPARSRIRNFLKERSDIKIAGEASNGKEAIELIRDQNPQLVLLDIQMPLLDGFDVVKLLGDDRPDVIFITAYDEYAVNAFEVHAVDYLLKPVKMERLFEAIDHFKTRDQVNQQQSVDELLEDHTSKNTANLQRLPVNYQQEVRFIDYNQICYIEADGKLTWVHTIGKKKFRTEFSLKELEQRFARAPLLRIHRSVIANLDLVKKVEPFFNDRCKLTMQNGVKLDVARRRVSKLKSELGMK